MRKALIPLVLASVMLFVLAKGRSAGTSTGVGLPKARVTIPVLCYHKFSRNGADLYSVTVSAFEEHLKYLSENGYRSISLTDLSALLDGTKPPPAFRPVLITVDDGFRSFSEAALPLLRKYGFSAVLFVYTDYVSAGKQALTWEELRVLAESGIEIGSHSCSHPNFVKAQKGLSSNEYRALVRKELEESRTKIEKMVGRPVIAFAAPYGLVTPVVRECARETGYRLLFTLSHVPNTERTDPFSVGRFLILRTESLSGFVRKVTSGAEPSAR